MSREFWRYTYPKANGSTLITSLGFSMWMFLAVCTSCTQYQTNQHSRI